MNRIWIVVLSLILAGPLPGWFCEVNAAQLVATIVTSDLPRYQQANQNFVQVVRSAGLDESKLQIFTQTPNADTMSLTNSIRRSVAAGAELLVTYGAAATLVAVKEAKDIPVLFVDVYDPVELGVVQTLSAPGVNRSGASGKIVPGPLLKALIKLSPKTRRLGILYSSGDAGSKLQLKDIAATAKGLGLDVVARDVKNAKQCTAAIADLNGKVDALFLTESVIVSQQAANLIPTASAQGLPVLSETPGQIDQGALLTMTASPAEQGKQVAVYALQVLAGQKAFLLPVREPKQSELAINLKASKALGLTPPPELLSTANKVID